MNIFVLVILMFIIEFEGFQSMKLLKFLPRSEDYRAASEYFEDIDSDVHQRYSSHQSRPQNHITHFESHNGKYPNSFVNQYKENYNLLKTIDPCVFNPCGENTVCIDRYYHSTRTCYCLHGYKPNPEISETCARPCDLFDCGINAFCVNDPHGIEHNCICKPGFQPVQHGTSHFQGCKAPVDPCNKYPCNPMNTICIAITETERHCLCKEGTGPINGNAAGFGCSINPCSLPSPCGPHAFCTVDANLNKMCICKEDFFNNDRTEHTEGCTIKPCFDTSRDSPPCQKNAYCTEDRLHAKKCRCLPGFTEDRWGKCVPDCSRVGKTRTFVGVGDDMCVHLDCSEKTDLRSAFTTCRNEISFLAAFKDEDGFDTLRDYLKGIDSKCDAWSGITDIKDPGTWVFPNNVQGPLTAYKFAYAWATAVPTDTNAMNYAYFDQTKHFELTNSGGTFVTVDRATPPSPALFCVSYPFD